MNLEKQKRFLIQAAFYAVAAALLYVGLKYLLPILMPFLLAFLIVWLLRKPACAVASRLHLREKPVQLIFLLLFYVLLFGLVSLAGMRLVALLKGWIPQLPALYRDELLPALKVLAQFIEDTVARFDPSVVSVVDSAFSAMSANIETGLLSLSGWVMSFASGVVIWVPSFIIQTVLTITSSFFLANDYNRVMAFIYGIMPAKVKTRVRDIWHKLAGSLWIYIRSYTLLLIVTFAELLIGLSLMKIPYAGLIAAGIAIFDLMPILGTGGVLIPWTVIAVVVGEYGMALGVAALYIVITIVRNSLEPKLVGKQIGLHPLATLIALFVGSQLFGLVGLFAFPVALSVIVQLRRGNSTAQHIPSDQPKY